MSEPFDIDELIETSRDAMARAGVAQKLVNQALDAIRSASTKSNSPFDLWVTIDEQIGKAKDPSLRQQLIEMRTRFENELLAAELARIEKAFRLSRAAGWNAWLSTLAESITQFRSGFSTQLCEHQFPFQASEQQASEEIRKAVRCLYQNQWPEAFAQLDYIARQDFLPDVIQARLNVILGQIQLIHFECAAPAKKFYDTAENLAPDDGKVLSALGDYWVKEKDIEKGKSYYERAINIAPEMPNAYTGIGECFENEKDLPAAEQWYQKAIAFAGGYSLGYAKLLSLYGHPEFFNAHEAELQTLMEQVIAVTPEDRYQIYLDRGYIYEQNEQFKNAQSWYEKAIALDETRPLGYVAVAQCYEKQKRNEEAETAYKKAIDVAPQYYDGYWGLTWFYEKQEKWEDALQWYQRVPLHIKEWAGVARAKIGEMHSKLQNYTEAERILKQELRADKDNDTAKMVLQVIADEYYQKHGDKNAAMRIYDEMLEILGNSYRGNYHNRLGNLNYFYGDYALAADQYRMAIAATTPASVVFHRNLAGAYGEMKDYAQAAQEIEKALQIDKDEKTFKRDMALLANAEGNDYLAQDDYRKAIELYTKATELDPSDDIIYSNLGGAWEQLTEHGGRLEALEKAIEAFKRAQDIKATEKYEGDIKRLYHKKDLVLSYGEKAIDWLHVVTPIAVEIAGNLIPYTEGSAQGSLSDELSKHLTEMKARIQNEFGVKIPGVRFRGSEDDLSDGVYVIMIMEIPLVSGTIPIDQRFFPGSADALLSLGVVGEKVTNPVTGGEGFWINKDDWKKVETAGLELWSVIEYLVQHLEAVVQHELIEFLGHQEVADLVKIESPETFEEMRATPKKLTALTAVCKGLLAEGVPIRPFGEIYGMFNQLYSEGANLQDIVEDIRSLPVLLSRLPGNDTRSSILPLGRRFEADIRNSIYQAGGSHPVLAMDPERCQNALVAFRNVVGEDRNIVVIVDDAELRPFVRLLIEIEFPDIPVLSRPELRPDLELKTLKMVELEEEDAPAKPDFSSRRQIDESGGESGRKDFLPQSNEIAITVFVNEAFPVERTEADEQSLKELFSLMQDGLFYELGIVLPEVRLEFDNTLESNEFRFKLNSRECSSFVGLKRDEFLVNDVVDRLDLLNIKGRKAVNPANNNECAIVREEEGALETCRQAGLTTWGPGGFLVLTLSAEIRKNAAAFQTINITQYILDSLRAAFPELIDLALKRFSVEQLCLVLRDLLDEEISIRDIRSILESMLSINGTTDVDLNRYIVFTPRAQNLCPVIGNKGLEDLAIADYSNFVRTSLKKYISYKYTRGGSVLLVYLLDREIERRISNIGSQPLTTEENKNLKEAVSSEIDSLPPTAQNPVLLTTMDIRRTVRKLIETDFPSLAVLSYQELSPEMNIQPLARISWS